MKERIFEDINGEKLIVKHRKSAIYFERETDLSIKGYVSPHWNDKTPVIEPSELKRKFIFSEIVFKDFLFYMEEIAFESWKSFVIKEEDSFLSDYGEYYDKDFDNNGYLSLKETSLTVSGPANQEKTENSIVRLYKFDKRKFESFLYDLRKLSLKEVN